MNKNLRFFLRFFQVVDKWLSNRWEVLVGAGIMQVNAFAVSMDNKRATTNEINLIFNILGGFLCLFSFISRFNRFHFAFLF